ncbi:Protein DD3-3 [Durusdinium trenchii]
MARKQLCMADGISWVYLGKANRHENTPEAFESELPFECGLFEVSFVSGPTVEGAEGETAGAAGAGPLGLLNSVAAVTVRIRIIRPAGRKELLCVQSEHDRVALTLGDGDACEWDLVRAGENQGLVKSKPCVWLRSMGKYLAADGSGHLVMLRAGAWQLVGESSHDTSDESSDAGCWAFGHQREVFSSSVWRREDYYVTKRTMVQTAPKHSFNSSRFHSLSHLPHVWLMASKSYEAPLTRLLGSFQRAGEALWVSVVWVSDFKDTKQQGFRLTGFGRLAEKVFAFNYLKLLFLFAAYLDSVTDSLETASTSMQIVMDLDVQVQRGWRETLQKCVENWSNAEICFLQQAAFGDKRWQQANSGVLVFRGGANAGGVGALFHALAARLVGQEILVRLLPNRDVMAFEQLLLNYILNEVRSGPGWKKNILRWGIYNPLVAYSGMFLTSAVLTDTVHHATASNADLQSKLRLMDAAQLFISDLREFCPSIDPNGGLLKEEGPLPEFCYYYIGIDPHFGPLLDHSRVHEGFSEEDNLIVLDHLQRRGRGRAWIQLVISFNEGGYKHWKARRRNSSIAMGDVLWNPSF